jgi:hypothetical protein
LKPEVGLGRPTASVPLRDRGPICEYVQTLSPNISYSTEPEPKLRCDARITRTSVRATLTTGTFNLLSKTDSHFRLSGAYSVRTGLP